MPASTATAKILTKLTAAAAAALAATAAAATVGTAAASASTQTDNWIATGWNIHLNDRADPGTAGHFFNSPGSFGTGTSDTATPITDGFATSGVLAYTSYAQFAADIATNAITYPYKWVLYDPEAWPQTPLSEQQNPARYLRLFGKLAHAHGYQAIEVPARDLGTVAGSTCPARPGQNLDTWYARCNIAGAAAAHATIFILQDQVNTTNVPEYDALFTSARTEALAANPHVQVDAEVSTNYGTPAQMTAAAQSVSANGYYISATTPTMPQADQFLQAMQTAGY